MVVLGHFWSPSRYFSRVSHKEGPPTRFLEGFFRGLTLTEHSLQEPVWMKWSPFSPQPWECWITFNLQCFACNTFCTLHLKKKLIQELQGNYWYVTAPLSRFESMKIIIKIMPSPQCCVLQGSLLLQICPYPLHWHVHAVVLVQVAIIVR